MSDLISRSAAIEAFEMRKSTFESMPSSVSNMIINAIVMCKTVVETAPAIDAVPVVRCKDCRYSESMKKHGVCKFGENALNCTQCRGDDGYGYAGISVIYPDDYCSDGAQKDGEADD